MKIYMEKKKIADDWFLRNDDVFGESQRNNQLKQIATNNCNKFCRSRVGNLSDYDIKY